MAPGMPADPDRSRRFRRVALTLATACFAGALVSWLVNKDGGAPAASPVAAAPVPNAKAAPAREALASALEPAAAAADGPSTDEVELCGGIWVKAAPDGAPDVQALFAASVAAADEVAAIAIAAMTASGSPRTQAAALYLQAARAERRELSVCSGEGCSRLRVEAAADAAPFRQALARLARDSSDARVYGWAYRSCAVLAEPAAGECAAIRVEQWVRLAPDDSQPWMAAAAEARLRQDDAGVDDAMFHVAQADRHASTFGALSAEIMDNLPRSDPVLLGTTSLAAQAMALDSLQLLAFDDAARYCDQAELADSNRRELCERIASGMVERATTALGRSQGAGLGRNLGWSAERIQTLERQREAEIEVAARRSSAGGAGPGSCPVLRASLDAMSDVARMGELESFRRKIAATGVPVAELAEQGRRRLAMAQEKASRAMAAASEAAPATLAAATATR